MRKKIMIDMDDVITKGGLLYLINNFLGTNYKEEDFKEYHLQDVLPDKESFFKYFITKNVYDYSKMIDNAYEVIKDLSEVYDVYIGTAYIYPEIKNDCGIFLKYKHEYLVRELPFIKPENYIFLTNKSLLNCEIKIDDKMNNLENADTKILFTAYHNQDISDEDLKSKGIVRANNWLDVKNILL